MKRVLPSTSTRLALLVMACFIVSFVLLGGGVYFAVLHLLEHDTRDLVRSDAVSLVETWRDGGQAALVAELQDRIHGDDGDPNAVYALVAAAGDRLVGDRPDSRIPGPRGQWVTFAENSGVGQRRVRVIAFEQRLPGGAVLLTGQRLQSQGKLLALMQHAGLAIGLIASLLGALVGWLTSRWVARRLRSLDATVARVGAGELGLRAPLDHSGDAFDQVAQRFNRMLDRIEGLMDGVRHATDHIAHDLRTPLTRLRNRLEGLHLGASDPPTRYALERALGETDQLLKAFAALLRLARIEAQSPVSEAPRLDLAELINDTLDMYAPIAAERHIRFLPTLAPVSVQGDRDQLFQLVVNLIDNALKYAPANGDIEVALQADGPLAWFDIADRGPGIPESERERVFDRFQRLEAHRGSPGIGLGLSLARAIVQHHGGRIELTDNSPGLRVRVCLPTRQVAAP